MTARRRQADVVVIGAGVSGLAAACDLAQAGNDVILLEARGRIGGRIHTIHDPQWPIPVELGAEFVHGAAEDTMALVRAAKLAADLLPDDHYLSRAGRLGSFADFWDTIGRVQKDIAARLKRTKARDFALSDYLGRVTLPTDVRQMLIDFVEGYHAAHIEKVSARLVAEGSDEVTGPESNQQLRLAGGYDAIPLFLRAGLGSTEVRLNTLVTGIRWKKREVVVQCRTTLGVALAEVRAKAAVIAVPHALLRNGAITITPAIPPWQRAIEKLEVGQVFKMMLRFREAFWFEDDFVRARLANRKDKPAALNFAHAHAAAVPTWWTTLPARAPVITGWAGGPRAERINAQPELARVDVALQSLSEALAVPRRLVDEGIEAWLVHDWHTDPFSLGAYTWPAVGGTNAQNTLSKAVEGTLALAGEFTDAEQTGTVAGAIASGRRAAKMLS